MQHVRFKDHSMEAARHGNEQDYYLFAIDGDYAVLKYLDGNVWRSRTVNLVALEVATPLCVLPVREPEPVQCPGCSSLISGGVELRDRLAELIQTVFDNEADFMQHFAMDEAQLDGGIVYFYMASERCCVRYEWDGFTRDTTIRTVEFLSWVEGLS